MSFTKANIPRKVVDDLIRGRPLSRIAEDLGITPEEAHEVWREHLRDNYSPWSDIELRYLTLARLERMVDLLWDQVAAGDYASEGRQTANLIKVIERVQELMALNKDPLAEAQVELTKAQTQLLHGMLVEMRTMLLLKVVETLQSLELTENQRETLVTLVESQWSAWYHEASQEALAMTRGQENT